MRRPDTPAGVLVKKVLHTHIGLYVAMAAWNQVQDAIYQSVDPFSLCLLLKKPFNYFPQFTDKACTSAWTTILFPLIHPSRQKITSLNVFLGKTNWNCLFTQFNLFLTNRPCQCAM